MNFIVCLVIFVTFFQLDVAILTIPSEKSIVTDSTKKEKRGVLGFGVHGHHHHSHHHHPEHYDDWHHLPPPPPPPHPPHLAHPSVPLGSHFHTTITKKVGIPYPVPVKIHVPVFKPYPVFYSIPHPVVVNSPHQPPPHAWPSPHHHKW